MKKVNAYTRANPSKDQDILLKNVILKWKHWKNTVKEDFVKRTFWNKNASKVIHFTVKKFTVKECFKLINKGEWKQFIIATLKLYMPSFPNCIFTIYCYLLDACIIRFYLFISLWPYWSSILFKVCVAVNQTKYVLINIKFIQHLFDWYKVQCVAGTGVE